MYFIYLFRVFGVRVLGVLQYQHIRTLGRYSQLERLRRILAASMNRKLEESESSFVIL